jgi:beta-N-acetylhexosaminidase
MDELFRTGVTVAYDNGDHVPITPDRSVAIIFLGTRYQIQNECSLYANPDNTRWFSISDSPDDAQIGSAMELANWADTAVVWTQEAIRTPEQGALVNALPQDKTVAVALWSPDDWTTYPNVSAFIATYSPLRPAVPAACEVLFGIIPEQGQLAVTLGEHLVAGSRDG